MVGLPRGLSIHAAVELVEPVEEGRHGETCLMVSALMLILRSSGLGWCSRASPDPSARVRASCFLVQRKCHLGFWSKRSPELPAAQRRIRSGEVLRGRAELVERCWSLSDGFQDAVCRPARLTLTSPDVCRTGGHAELREIRPSCLQQRGLPGQSVTSPWQAGGPPLGAWAHVPGFLSMPRMPDKLRRRRAWSWERAPRLPERRGEHLGARHEAEG